MSQHSDGLVMARVGHQAGSIGYTMSIRLKLVLGYNLFLIALAALGFLTYWQLERSRDTSRDVSSEIMERAEQASHLDDHLDDLRSLELAYLLESDPLAQRGIASELAETLRDIDTGMRQYVATITKGPAPPDFLQFQENLGAYLGVHERIVALASEGRQQEAQALYIASDGEFRALMNLAHSLRHAAYQEAEAATSQAASFTSRAQYILMGGLVGVALFIFAIGHPLATYIDRRLHALLEGTRRVSRGQLDQPIGGRGGDEFDTLAQAFDSMVGSLRSARDEAARLHAQALAMQEERIALLQQRMSQVVKAQEQERQRVARELHDQAGQALTALQLGLSRLELAGLTPEIQEEAAALRQLTVEAMHTIHNLALDLRPSALDELGLPAALQDYIDTFSRRTGLAAKLEVSGQRQRLPVETEVALFRIAQEGLTNVAKHAQASHITIALAFEPPTLRLVIEDNGIGFDVERALTSGLRQSLGLMGMQERCRLLGGELKIHSRPRQGTKLVISLPLSRDTASTAKEEELSKRR